MRCGAQCNVVTSCTICADSIGLMIISTDTKITGKVVVAIGLSVLIGVDNFCKLCHLGNDNVTGTN